MKISPTNVLLFFDVHVSHVHRIKEANYLVFKTIVFDDNYPLDQIYVDGWPPIPTLDMCLDDLSRKITDVSWVKNNLVYHRNWNINDLNVYRNLIKIKIDYPSLYEECGYKSGSKMSCVKLR